MKDIQRGEYGEAIAAAFNVKGAVAPKLDEQQVGTYETVRIDASPWRIPQGICTGIVTKVAVVGQYSYCGLVPAPNTIVSVKRVLLDNDTAGTSYFIIGLLRPSYTLTTIATVAAIALNRNTLWSGARSFTAEQVGGNIDQMMTYQLAANSSVILDFGSPIIFGPGAAHDRMCVRSETQNEVMRAGFVADEYYIS